MTAILGISAFYHDSAAALVVDGKIVAAAQEERFSRIKHDHEFPQQAVDYCLRESGLKASDLDLVGFYDKPLLKFDRLLETYLSYAPAGFRSFLKAMPLWLRQKLHLPREMNRALNKAYKRRYVFVRHHESHAASAFFPSPFEEAALLTLDGVGEWSTAALGSGQGNRIRLSHELRFPHSLGLLYSAFTYYCGFKVNSGEYKLMGLAPYGEPIYADLIRDKLLDLKEDGSFRMDMSYFNYCQGLTMTSEKLHSLFQGPPRKPESPLTQREMNVAASIQKVTEEVVLRAGRHVHRLTGHKNLCMAGGVALNCVANGRLLREGPFERIWIQPAAGDAGGALGTALFIWHQLMDHPREPETPDGQRASLLGPEFSPEEIQSVLDSRQAVYHRCGSQEELCSRVAQLLEEEKVVGWMQGRMEFGPRALGSRSILGDARSERMQSVMNRKIKFRESFRPFAPIVLREKSMEYFQLDPDGDSPYMLLVAPVRESQRLDLPPEEQDKKGLDKLGVTRSRVPAVTHVDYSARVQTVDRRRNPLLHRLMRSFEERTGCPVLINTSFNVRGEPIVCTPQDAYHCFRATDMDVLAIGPFVLLKGEQKPDPDLDRRAYLEQFELD
ncbi:MAG TPA: carbamoyltransferase [Acidobacteriota bacterium]|nr:carbamoyltransferase [Acidobacteriota bacterium]